MLFILQRFFFSYFNIIRSWHSATSLGCQTLWTTQLIPQAFCLSLSLSLSLKNLETKVKKWRECTQKCSKWIGTVHAWQGKTKSMQSEIGCCGDGKVSSSSLLPFIVPVCLFCKHSLRAISKRKKNHCQQSTTSHGSSRFDNYPCHKKHKQRKENQVKYVSVVSGTSHRLHSSHCCLQKSSWLVEVGILCKRSNTGLFFLFFKRQPLFQKIKCDDRVGNENRFSHHFCEESILPSDFSSYVNCKLKNTNAVATIWEQRQSYKSTRGQIRVIPKALGGGEGDSREHSNDAYMTTSVRFASTAEKLEKGTSQETENVQSSKPELYLAVALPNRHFRLPTFLAEIRGHCGG